MAEQLSCKQQVVGSSPTSGSPRRVSTPATAHVLRHTAGTAVERIAGHAVAQGFLGHEPGSVTGTYTKARIDEIAAAVSVLTGEPHPLATAA